MPKTARPDTLPLPESEYYLKRIRRPIPNDTKAQVRKLWNNRCAYCGAIYSQFHYDHVFPHALGGSDGVENLVYACEPCNKTKLSRVMPGRTAGDMILAFQRERVPGGPHPTIPALYGVAPASDVVIPKQPRKYQREASRFILHVLALPVQFIACYPESKAMWLFKAILIFAIIRWIAL